LQDKRRVPVSLRIPLSPSFFYPHAEPLIPAMGATTI
jgi:hypothetical protein